MQYDDDAQNVHMQRANSVPTVSHNASCVTFAGDALMNGAPGFLYTFQACDLSAESTGIGNFAIAVTGPLGFVYQKSGAVAAGFVYSRQP